MSGRKMNGAGRPGIVVAGIGALQVLAGLVLPAGKTPLTVSGALLVVVGLAFLRPRSSKLLLGGTIATGVQLAVFLYVMLGDPFAVPRIAVLGIFAAVVALAMAYKSATAQVTDRE